MDSEKSLFVKVEGFVDNVVQHTKKFLPHAARVCLVSTFIEDGIRMCVQWNVQRDSIAHSWGCDTALTSLYLFFVIVSQIGACVGIVLQKRVSLMCGCLLVTIATLAIAHESLFNHMFLLRDLSLVGAILLLLAQSKSEEKPLTAGVPSINTDKTKAYIQLTGRVLLILLFFHVIHFKSEPFIILLNSISIGCMLCITVGFRARLFAFFLVFTLFVLNFGYNQFWKYSGPMFDYKLFDFFQIISVIGGLLFVVEKGPGDFSYDEYKKSV